MRRPRVSLGCAALLLAGIVMSCSKSSPATSASDSGKSVPPTTATGRPAGEGSTANTASSRGGGSEGQGDGSNGESGGSSDGREGTSSGDAVPVGLNSSDAEQLRMIYLDKGFSPEAADCIVSTVVAELQGRPVTQDILTSALIDAAERCGSATGGGGDVTREIIDNYPTGGAPVSTTIVSGGGQSPVDNFPTGG